MYPAIWQENQHSKTPLFAFARSFHSRREFSLFKRRVLYQKYVPISAHHCATTVPIPPCTDMLNLLALDSTTRHFLERRKKIDILSVIQGNFPTLFPWFKETLSYFFLRLRKHSPARAFNLGDDFRSGPVVFPSSGDAPQRGKLFRGTGFPKDIGSHKSAPPGIGVR